MDARLGRPTAEPITLLEPRRFARGPGSRGVEVLLGPGVLAELGDPASSHSVLPLLQHKEAKIRQAAANAMTWMARPGNANAIFALQAALQHSDPAVQVEAALGLAYCGDPTGSSIIFTAGAEGMASRLPGW